MVARLSLALPIIWLAITHYPAFTLLVQTKFRLTLLLSVNYTLERLTRQHLLPSYPRYSNAEPALTLHHYRYLLQHKTSCKIHSTLLHTVLSGFSLISLHLRTAGNFMPPRAFPFIRWYRFRSTSDAHIKLINLILQAILANKLIFTLISY